MQRHSADGVPGAGKIIQATTTIGDKQALVSPELQGSHHLPRLFHKLQERTDPQTLKRISTLAHHSTCCGSPTSSRWSDMDWGPASVKPAAVMAAGARRPEAHRSTPPM